MNFHTEVSSKVNCSVEFVFKLSNHITLLQDFLNMSNMKFIRKQSEEVTVYLDYKKTYRTVFTH